MAYKGKFRCKNPKKYMGDSSNITYRSRWELLLMMRLDQHPHVVQWGSEELIIPYRSPIDGRVHRYFTDFIVKRINKDTGKKETVVIEVKPYKETIAPKKQKKKTKRYLNEVKTWGINQAKWKAAEAYCADRGWKFIKMTEHELGIK